MYQPYFDVQQKLFSILKKFPFSLNHLVDSFYERRYILDIFASLDPPVRVYPF